MGFEQDIDSYMFGTMRKYVDNLRTLYGPQGPRILLDIGSRNAYEATLFAQAFPSARIVSFEPNPAGYNLCKNIVQDYSNIDLYQLAVSDYEGYADFYVVGVNDGGSSLLEPIDVPFSDGTHTKITVNVRRLDNFLKELGVDTVDGIWMDVQGTELQVLQGLGSLLDKVRVIHAEASPLAYYRGQCLKQELENFLADKGFALEFHAVPGHPYQEGDFVCVRK